MRNHDFVSDGFLAVTAAGLVLLCSSLLAFAFSWRQSWGTNSGSPRAASDLRSSVCLCADRPASASLSVPPAAATATARTCIYRVWWPLGGRRKGKRSSLPG